MQRIRILRIQHSFVEPTNHRLLDELARYPELEVHALCPEWGIESGNLRELKNPERPDLETAKTVLTRHYATTVFVQKLASAIRRLKPDVICVHEEPYSLTAGQALLYRRLFSPGSKVIFCSAKNIYKDLPPPFSMIEKWMYREASGGYGCCEGVVEVGRRMLRVPPLSLSVPPRRPGRPTTRCVAGKAIIGHQSPVRTPHSDHAGGAGSDIRGAAPERRHATRHARGTRHVIRTVEISL
jgi:hypothetical protein